MLSLSLQLAGPVQPQPLPDTSLQSIISSEVLRYEIVSIKPHPAADATSNTKILPNGLILTNVSVASLLRQAYGEEFIQDRILKMPEWARNRRFDIEAKISDDDIVRLDMATGSTQKQILRWQQHLPSPRMLMLQSLLMEHFGCAVHHSNLIAPVFLMTLAKDSRALTADLQTEAPDDLTDGKGQRTQALLRVLPGELRGQGISMDYLAQILQPLTGRTVVNHTGLTGLYDFTVRWSWGSKTNPGSPQVVETPSADQNDEITIVTALRQQLGLKLRIGKAPVDFLIIDHLQLPDPN